MVGEQGKQLQIANQAHVAYAIPAWKKPKKDVDTRYYATERRKPGDKPWTDIESEMLVNSKGLMLNGFTLTKAGKIPAAVQWATKHSRKMYFENSKHSADNDDEGVPDGDADLNRRDYNIEA